MIAMTPWLWMKYSGALFVINIKDDKSSSLIEAGRALSRIWTKANALGISVQPSSSAILLMLHLRKTDAKGFSSEQKKQIEKVKGFMDQCIPANSNPCMMLRLGYAKPPKSRTPRRKIEEILSFK